MKRKKRRGAGETQPGSDAWDQGVAAFRADFRVLPVMDHNAYHLGQLVVIRHGLGAWQA